MSTAHLLAAVAADLAASESEGKDEEEERTLPLRLMEVVRRGGAALEGVLQGWKVGEPAPTIPPGCAAHTAAMGYLLTWRVVLKLVSEAGQELRPRYSEFLRIRGHLDQLLDLLFRLLPSSPLPTPDYFCPQLDPSSCPPSELEQLAGSCWVAVCRHLPALARQWWQERDKQAGAAVEKLTSAIVTPLLWREETKAIETAAASDNMSLRVRDSVREVVATYSIDEGSMELVVSLPANHPLGGLSVESGKRVGVDTGQWRKWMLQLTTFLTHQNGTILDGLDLWRRNVDKRFEGVEVRNKDQKVILSIIFNVATFARSATSASTSCTAPTTSCQSLLVELARRSSTLLVSTSGSPHQTIPLVRCAETSSEEFCNKLIPSSAVLWDRCRNIHISNVILECKPPVMCDGPNVTSNMCSY